MSEQHLVEALNDCIDRLASGQSLETCLRAYPDLADELRPLLLAARLPRRAHADSAEVRAMRARLDARIEATLTATDFGGSRWRLPPGTAVLLVASLVAVVVGFAALAQRPPGNPAAEVTTSPIPTQATPTITAEPTASPTERPLQAEPTTDSDMSTDSPSVLLEDAIETALDIFPSSAVSSTSLETWDDGRLVWDIELDDDRRGVDIDAMTGVVLFFGYEFNDNNSISAGETDDVQSEIQHERQHEEQPAPAGESSGSESSAGESSEPDD